MSDSATPWLAACQAPLSFAISWSLLRFMSIESVMLSNHLILCWPLSFCLQSFPASASFPMSQLFTSGDQSIGASASASVLLMNIQGWFPLELPDWISLQSKGLSRVFSSTITQRHQFFGTQPFLWSNSHICYDYWKNYSLIILTFVSKVISLLLNMLSRFVIAFLSRNKHLFNSWLQSPSTVTLELKRKAATVSTFSLSIAMKWWDGKASQVALVVRIPPANAGNMRCGFDPWVWKIPWRRAWKPTPVFLLGESHGQRSLAGYSPWGRKESDTTEELSTHSMMELDAIILVFWMLCFKSAFSLSSFTLIKRLFSLSSLSANRFLYLK